MSDGLTTNPSGDAPATSDQEKIDVASRLEAFAQQLNLVKEIEALKRDVWRFKTVGTIVILLAGLLGFKTITDVRSSAEEGLKRSTEETTSYYSDLLTGYAHVNSQNYRAAIPVLEKCLANRRLVDKQYDSSLLAPLLMSYNEIDDWESAEKTIQILEQNENRLSLLRDAWVYLNIGSIRVQEALDDPTKLESGVYWLRLARQLTPIDDAEMRRDISISSWMAALVQKDLKSSKQYVAEAFENDQAPRQAESWEDTRDSRFFRELFRKSPELQEPARTMWTEQYQRRIPLSAVSLAKGQGR